MLWLGQVGNCDYGGMYFCGVVLSIHYGRLSCSNKKVVVHFTYGSSNVSQEPPAEAGGSGPSSNEDRPVVVVTLTSVWPSAEADGPVVFTPTITSLQNSLLRIRVVRRGRSYSCCFCSTNRFMRNFSLVHLTQMDRTSISFLSPR